MADHRGSGFGWAVIAAVVVGLAALFAWAAGFLSPDRVSGGRVASVLQQANGPHPGFRRAHAKGMCVSGRFVSNGAGVPFSTAALFRPGVTLATGRFSINAGNPDAPDGAAVFHALGLRFVLPGGEEWRMAIDHTPIFIVSNVRDFIALQRANMPDPRTGKPDPAAMPRFVAGHPETAAFLAYVKAAPLPSSFANGTYHSIHAFRFTAADGSNQLARFQFEPETPFSAITPAAAKAAPPDFLFDDLQRRIGAGPLRWHLILIPANPGDVTNNATTLWTGPHRRLDVGTLVLDHSATEAAGGCRDFNFDPLILPRGVAAGGDPLLPVRSAVYSASFRRRALEGPRPDALTLADRRTGHREDAP